MNRYLTGFALCLLPMLLAGCRQDMHDAPRYDPLEASNVFPKGSSAQPLVAGTVPRGFLHEDELLYTGRSGTDIATTFPFAITAANLDRGQERFDIYCAPCHGRTGDGNGMVVKRGFKAPPTYHTDRLRTVPVGYLYDVITSGFGAMPDYRAQVPVEDRWFIVAYIRALQLTQMAKTTDVPADELKRLESGAAAGAAARERGGQ